MGSVGSTLDVFWVDFAKSQAPFCNRNLRFAEWVCSRIDQPGIIVPGRPEIRKLHHFW